MKWALAYKHVLVYCSSGGTNITRAVCSNEGDEQDDLVDEEPALPMQFCGEGDLEEHEYNEDDDAAVVQDGIQAGPESEGAAAGAGGEGEGRGLKIYSQKPNWRHHAEDV